MKKVILSLVFLLATGTTLMNAKNLDKEKIRTIETKEDLGKCDEVYNAVRDTVTAITGDFYAGILAAIRAEEVCLEAEEEFEILE